MTSHRKRKKAAQARGLSPTELELLETVEEMLESLKWLKVLGYSNQFTINRELLHDQADRDRVLEAATRAVDNDADLRRWQNRLANVRRQAERIQTETGAGLVAGLDAASDASATKPLQAPAPSEVSAPPPQDLPSRAPAKPTKVKRSAKQPVRRTGQRRGPGDASASGAADA